MRSCALNVEFEAVIGIETHVQLATASKAFCSCPSLYGAEPNLHVCPVCMGHPGTLPNMNAQAVLLGVRAGIALHSQIARRSKFDRKQYFYADLPKGYQISQYDEPLCTGGYVEVENAEGVKTRIRLQRAHLEEDAGKIVYAGAGQISGSDYSLVDYNRAGVPLLEVVTEPDMRSGKEAYAYGDELRRILRFAGISDGNMSEGSLRCDVNISVRPKGSETYGTRVEVKNMNSFANMQKAIDFEFERQVALNRSGKVEEIVCETRLWDEVKLVTYAMRRKEGLADYRYFPEPDLPPLVISEEMIDGVKASMPELPSAKRARYQALGLSRADVVVLADEQDTAQLFDSLLLTGVTVKTAANWIQGDITAYCKESKLSMAQLKVTPAALAEMIYLIEDNTISGKIAKDLLPELLQGKGNAGVKALCTSKGLLQISDEASIMAMIDVVLAANPKQLAEFKGGKVNLKSFFEGQVMKQSKGRVNPGKMQQLIAQRLAAL
ncbi:MAG: hypothetical protein WDW38_005561 [Sanguina aurantia]